MTDHHLPVLDALAASFRRFVLPGDPDDIDLLALWTAHTHLTDRLGVSPRLLITAPMWGAGKTTTAEHVVRLARGGKRLGSGLPSVPVLRHYLSGGGTLVLDESEKSLSGSGDAIQLTLAAINDGVKAGAVMPVNLQTATGWDVTEVPIFGPLALVGNNPPIPPDVLSRFVTVRLIRDERGTVEMYDDEAHDEETDKLRARLTAWAAAQTPEQARQQVTLPEGVTGRLRDVWRPLKRVAMLAGGDWPAIADDLAARHLDVPGHQVGSSRLTGGRPPSALWRRSVL